MAATAAHELTMQQQQQQADLIARFYKELNIVPGPNAGRMLHVYYHHSSYLPNSALAMKDASRKMKGSATDYRDEVQPQTIRITLSLATHKSLPRADVETALISHFDTAKPQAMCLFTIPTSKKLGSEFDHLLSDISGISSRVIPADPTKGCIHAVHTYDIHFRNGEAFTRASTLPPFKFRGLTTVMTLPHSPIDRLVEIRLHCQADGTDPDYWLNGMRVALHKSAEAYNKTWGTKIATPEILHFQRNLEVVAGTPDKLVFKGDYWCYVQLPEEAMTDVDFNTFLPVHLTTKNGAVVALNNDLQVGFCGYCRRPGHVRSACPIFQAKTQRQVVGLNRAAASNPKANDGWAMATHGKKHRLDDNRSPATGPNVVTLSNAFAGLEDESLEEEDKEEEAGDELEQRDGDRVRAEKEDNGEDEEAAEAMEVEQGLVSGSSPAPSREPKATNSNSNGLGVALSTPSSSHSGSSDLTSGTRAEESITTGALRAMLEKAGVLQRPRCYPHPGALPPKYQFVNYYAPARPMERMAHFSTFSLNREPDTTIRIIAGDLNDCPNLAVDRKSVSPGPRPASHATHWRTLIGRIPYSVIDTIRYLHPHVRQFSWPHRQKGVIKSWSRIDHILLSEQHAHLLVSGTTFVDAPLSDHRPVSVTIACPSDESSTAVPSLPETSSQLFRVNTRVYADEAFAARIPFIIDASRSDHARHLNRQFLTMKAALERRTHELEALPVLDDQKQAEWQDSVSMNKRLILERARQLRIRPHIPELSSEEPLSHTVYARLAGRRTTIKIDALRLADESISTDLVKCLEHIQTHFQSHHTPDDRDVAQVEDARSTLLHPVQSA
ncbi:BQ2448_3027 [Microbotryum intermedium]|uniref:BQ2448_3027 protein n=1 Tax=Microbotryum intermedium TaxID=269621 RepID=A0A238FF61_9BASI|nr:BQ2448_3027 [Microbotryum intermedium]